MVQSALLDADLGVAAGVLAPTPGDVRVEGTIAFEDPKLVGAGGPTVEFGAKRLAFGMKELLLPGVLPEQPPIASADGRLTGGSVTIEAMRVARTEPSPVDLRVGSLDAAIDELTAPGIGPPPADGGALQLRGKMGVTDLFVGNAGGSALDLGVRKVDVGVGSFVLPGMLAPDRATVTAPMKLDQASLTLADPSAVGSTLVSTPQQLDARARTVTVGVGELLVPGAMGGVPGDTQLRDAKLDVADPRMVDWRVGKLDVRARSIDVDVDDLIAPPAGAAAGPRLRGGRFALAQPAVAGADPKVFAIGAQSIGVGIQEMNLPGAAAPGAARVRLRDVTLAAPRVQVTRTAEGIELPFGDSGGGDRTGPAPAATTTTPSSATAPATAAPAAARPRPSAPAASSAGRRRGDTGARRRRRQLPPERRSHRGDRPHREAVLRRRPGRVERRPRRRALAGDGDAVVCASRPPAPRRARRAPSPSAARSRRVAASCRWTGARSRCSSSIPTPPRSRPTASGAAACRWPPRRRSARASTTPRPT